LQIREEGATVKKNARAGRGQEPKWEISIQSMLKEFKGVLASDFYAAYDASSALSRSA